jgi:hypothetical protein
MRDVATAIAAWAPRDGAMDDADGTGGGKEADEDDESDLEDAIARLRHTSPSVGRTVVGVHCADSTGKSSAVLELARRL